MKQHVTGTAGHKHAMALRVMLYLLLVTSPLTVRTFAGGSFGRDLPTSAGLVLGLTGFAVLALQPVLSSRFRWIERPFGLDRLLRFHRMTGATGAAMVLVHPLMLAVGRGSWRLLLSMDLPWPLIAAKITLLVLLLFAAAAIFRPKLRIPFQMWFRAHSWLTPVILAGIFVHSYFAAIRFQSQPLKLTWVLLLGTGLFAYLHLTLWRRLGGRLRAWNVKAVEQVTKGVWDIRLEPPAGRSVFDYLPGQFLFITLLRGRGLPTEEHPFTISSSPSEKGSLRISPKESGDFTSTVGSTRKGDRAAVMAPYGRFSHLLYPSRKLLVFIAGGIGITPMMSMLRFMRDKGDDRRVLLLYANRSLEDIAFRNELEAMASVDGPPLLELVHVLSRPEPSWQGRTGYVDREKLAELLPEISDSSFFVCGPPPMMTMVEKTLLDMGVERQDIHMERFSL